MVKDLKPPRLACKGVYKGEEMKEQLKREGPQGINQTKSEVTTGRPEL